MRVPRAAHEIGELGMECLRVEAVAVPAGDPRHPRAEAAHDDGRRRIGPQETRLARPQLPDQRDRVHHALRAGGVAVDLLADRRLLGGVRRSAAAAGAQA